MDSETVDQVESSSQSGSEDSSLPAEESTSTEGSRLTEDNSLKESSLQRSEGAEPKKESRYAQQRRKKRESIEKLARERSAFESERSAFMNEMRSHREAMQRERQAVEDSKKPKRDYTLEQLQDYKGQWQEELEALEAESYPDDDQKKEISNLKRLLKKTDSEIAAMQAEEQSQRNLVEMPRFGTQQHQAIWHQCEAELRQQDPDFQKEGSRLDKHLRALFASANGQHYRSHPRGIYAAYAEAQRQMLVEDVQKLKTENAKLKALTSIGGGVPARPGINGDSRPFEALSSKEMRDRLLKGPAIGSEHMPFL